VLSVLRLSVGGLRIRPASFFGLATAMFLAVAVITLFGSLIAAALTSGTESELAVIGGAFGEVAMVMALFVAVTTIGFAVRQQYRDIALLRTIAANPLQVRRLVRLQVVGVVAVVSPPAWLVGWIGAHRFLTELSARDLAPAHISIPVTPWPMPIASAVAVLVGTLSTSLATWRISRCPPAAMLDTGAEDDRLGWLRVILGSIVLAGAGVLSVFVTHQEPDNAAQGALLGTLVVMVGLGLLGPLLARLVVTLLGRPLILAGRRGSADSGGWLAALNLQGHANRLTSAVVPIALLVGLSTTFLAVTGTIQHTHPGGLPQGGTSDNDSWLRGVELIMLAGFGAVATTNTLIALTVARRREYALLTLIGATRRQLIRMLGAEALLIAATGIVLGCFVAVPMSIAFAVALTDSPVPWISMGRYLPILVASALLSVVTTLAAGIRAISHEPTSTLTMP
jgi:putative ABC transport system permease protein